MAVAYAFTKEDMRVDQTLGYPRSYAKLCNDTSISPYNHGPPLCFTPYSLPPQEVIRAKELDDMFAIDPQAKPTANPTMFVSLLWKQLNHLGNAGFDPAMFRVDPYGNVLYFHADPSSPLAWDIDHWFPCSRGGLTVPSNLRILQWQVCRRKHNQLEFLVPWWDFQLGISISQFLSIFAASNSDFRKRAFRWLFSEGENEEMNGLQTVESHNFPHPFVESKDQLGLAPAALVRTRRESFGSSSSTLRSLDLNRQSRPTTPTIAAARKFKNGGLKENDVPDDMVTNPYQAIVMARDSLKQREETNKMKAEIQRLDYEVNDLKLKNEEEKLTIQELELELMKRRRRAEKCRKLADTQLSYRSMLEKMIRNAMHQSIVYKEQVRQNQAATEALVARLEAQMAICKSAEKELHKRFKQRDELEKRIRPEWEQARKRSRTDEYDDPSSEEDTKTLIHLPITQQNDLGVFLDEEHKLSEEGREVKEDIPEEPLRLVMSYSGPEIVEDTKIRMPSAREAEVEEEDEQLRQERGKGNVEKWLHMLLGDAELEADELSPPPPQPSWAPETSKTDEIIRMLNEKYPQKERKVLKLHDDGKKKEKAVEMEPKKTRSTSTPRRSVSSMIDVGKGSQPRRSFERGDKGKGIVRSESARSLRPIPSSPSMILNMRKGVDCIRKKPLVIDDEDNNEYGNENRHPMGSNNFIKSSDKSIWKRV